MCVCMYRTHYAPFSAPAPAPFWMHMRKFLAEGASTRPLLKRSTRLWRSVGGNDGNRVVSYGSGMVWWSEPWLV